MDVREMAMILCDWVRLSGLHEVPVANRADFGLVMFRAYCE